MQYVVVGHCAQFTVRFPDGRPGRQMLFKGQPVPPTATQAEIDHHLSVGLIRAVAGQEATEPPLQQPVTTVDPVAEQPPAGAPEQDAAEAEVEAPASASEAAAEPDAEPDPAGDGDTKWEAALNKARQLHEQQKAPDGRYSPLVLGAWLTLHGYDRAAVEKAEKDDLLALVNNLSK
jgi:hypothetical protein